MLRHALPRHVQPELAWAYILIPLTSAVHTTRHRSLCKWYSYGTSSYIDYTLHAITHTHTAPPSTRSQTNAKDARFSHSQLIAVTYCNQQTSGWGQRELVLSCELRHVFSVYSSSWCCYYILQRASHLWGPSASMSASRRAFSCASPFCSCFGAVAEAAAFEASPSDRSPPPPLLL